MMIEQYRRSCGLYESIVSDIETLAGFEEDCTPEPEKVLASPTPAQTLCALQARATYLLAIIAAGGNQDECAKAYTRYCDAVDVCAAL